MCEYELPINLKNFTPKDLTGVKFRGGGYFFSETPCISVSQYYNISVVTRDKNRRPQTIPTYIVL